jgi:hypothetical protein
VGYFESFRQGEKGSALVTRHADEERQ